MDKAGFIEITRFDDRNIPQAEKEAKPILNPKWEPFAACVAGQGLEVRSEPATAYKQADLDRLVALVNQQGPFEQVTLKGLVYTGTKDADALLGCAHAHLK